MHELSFVCDCTDVAEPAQEDMDGWALFNGLYTTL